MKYNILKLTTVALLFLFLGVSCKKDEIYDDESIKISSCPGISVYKTKKDYFNYVNVGVNEEGELIRTPGYTKNSSRIKIDEHGNITFSNRWRLKNGYIATREGYFNAVFTDISIQEFVDYTERNNTGSWPDSLIYPRIIDSNPYTTFYHYNGVNRGEIYFSLGELNKMIDNGTIEEQFEKIK